MDCVIFIGIQASGKSTFYKEHFFNTHMRINLDMLKTRYREKTYVEASIHAKQSFVVDNTNPTKLDRKKYIDAVKGKGYKVIGYYFEPDYDGSIVRNELRDERYIVPLVGIKSTINRLEKPHYDEGFDELFTVKLVEGNFKSERLE
ncbi:ATP-binding protein [Paenibacillus sp. GSMTC-2017]|uniref:AAA family ATPase n=1 Tax=Paenibacillus sp. GSMTC-2017 TaxID=2794350 RepID=UPI0018D9E199|nr:ATP-binding protein [Paenibacillus sp. GSMTC-2017]MBH5316523.1 ATP-binding protein [Paenibacillus sp. GSMTC-2017]